MTRITNPDEQTPIETQLPSNGKTILLAEDDPFISRMYQTKLTNSGFNIIIKTNGRDAYQAIKEVHPDLMMLDISMPELTGLEVLATLSNDGYDFSTSPVIVLTNSSDAELRKQAEGYGAEYLVKAELTPHDVEEKINEKLGLGGDKGKTP
ncbi:MAG: response regulator transcription factor [Candidatus Saccharimonadia bacterium]